jgi:hypothetical protein
MPDRQWNWIDQSFRGVDDVFGAWERAAFDNVDIVPETIDSLCLDLLIHLVAHRTPSNRELTARLVQIP